MTLSGGLNSSAKYLARFACTVIMNCKQNFLSKRQKYLVRNLTQFVPQYNPPCQKDKDDFSQFLRHYDNILVLTGAGISTESGIPDYRSEGVGVYNRTTYKPINYTTFLNDRSARIRYWARNYIGWPKFSSAVPNKTHFSLVELECTPNKISTIITQNVDGLHHKAGSSKVIELHGNAYWVQCLQCKNLTTRHDFQRILDSLNPNLKIITTTTRPDGDTDVDKEIYDQFNFPDCENCGGILKPTVVFFGDNVPQTTVKNVENLVEGSDALLVIGTTLSTQSSLRIVNQAYELCKFICIVNIGATRGDKMADLQINTNCSDIFQKKKVTGLFKGEL